MLLTIYQITISFRRDALSLIESREYITPADSIEEARMKATRRFKAEYSFEPESKRVNLIGGEWLP